MAIKFYKKFSPNVSLLVDGIGKIEFTTLDTVIGYYATDSEHVQEAFARMMREQRGGISEISPKEFSDDYAEKKKELQTSPLRWREEMSGSSVRPQGFNPVERPGGERVVAALGVAKNDAAKKGPFVMETPAEMAKPAQTEKPKFSPPSGKRVLKKK